MRIPRPETSFEPIEEVLYGATAARALTAAMDLRLFERLEAGEMTAAALAGAVGAIPDRLEALLDLLAAKGVLAKSDQGYANTQAASEYLVPDKPMYQGRAMALNMHFFEPLEKNLAQAMCRADNARGEADTVWATDEIMEGMVGHAMGGPLLRVTRLTAGLPGFFAMRAMCDVGGNHGTFTMALLDENPSLSGVILDLPHVAPLSEKRCRERGYGDRITARSFDLRTDEIGEAEFDLAVASHVLYGVAEDLERGVGRIARALRPGGWLVSHHFAPGYRDPGLEACHELLTRLAGYPTHYLPREMLQGVMARHGFGDFVAEEPKHPLGGGLILAGRKGK
ncbi:class I SAM-dependent methyltransferase [Desulfolutivibrio sulfoxidireducens]|uniref:class I SAM-dependent methyltransferase n=1 Tax=Desulfolutivibrio sulfoxidireducens TaxID=2773299 RepID=UPI00159EB614|nr:class I SAM-dependent methyltransferase [Desulfolutivibrio sulfoxidireducens]QLA20985.1 methyltransferase [Desulfolutivibrio sulfoxidireducens]